MISRLFLPPSIRLPLLPSSSVVSEFYCIIFLWCTCTHISSSHFALPWDVAISLRLLAWLPLYYLYIFLTILLGQTTAALCNFLFPQTYFVLAAYWGFSAVCEVTEPGQQGVSWYLKAFLIDCCLKILYFPCQQREMNNCNVRKAALLN